MAIKEITFVSDFLKPSPTINSGNEIRVIQIALRAIFGKLVPGMAIKWWPDPVRSSSIQASFYTSIGNIPTQAGWARIWDKPLAPNILALLADSLGTSLVISYQLPVSIINALNYFDIPYLDLSRHPAAFLGNAAMYMGSNIKGLQKALQPWVANDELIHSCASELSDYMRKPAQKRTGKVAVFVCQPSDDSGRIANGHFQVIEDFEAEVFSMIRAYDQMLVIQDGQRDTERTDLFLTQLCPNTALSSQNFYDLLINVNICEVCSISSPRSLEAGYFGIPGRMLGSNMALEKDDRLPILHILSRPAIWQRIFTLAGLSPRAGEFSKFSLPKSGIFAFPAENDGQREADDCSQTPESGLPEEFEYTLEYLEAAAADESNSTADLPKAQALPKPDAQASDEHPDSPEKILDNSGIAMEQYQRDAVLDFVRGSNPVGKVIVEIGSDWSFAVAMALLALGAKKVIAANPWFPDYLASPDERIVIFKQKLEDLAMHEPVADMILGIAILEHADTPVELAMQCQSLLKPGGFMWLNGAPVWTCNAGHHIYLPKSDSIQGEYYFFAPDKNPWAGWQHLAIVTREEAEQALADKGLPEGDISAISDSLLTSDFISRKTPTEIIEAFKGVFGDSMQVHRIHDGTPPNAWYELAKTRFSEEDLQSYGIVIKAYK